MTKHGRGRPRNPVPPSSENPTDLIKQTVPESIMEMIDEVEVTFEVAKIEFEETLISSHKAISKNYSVANKESDQRKL